NFVAASDAANGIDATARLVRQNGLDTGFIANVSIVDRSGRGKYAGASGIGPIDISKREHFAAALSGIELVIGKPIVAQIRRLPGIPFARPVRSPDGRVVGVVATVVDAATFVDGYDARDIGEHGSLSIIGVDDHVVRSRFTLSASSGGRLVSDATF